MSLACYLAAFGGLRRVPKVAHAIPFCSIYREAALLAAGLRVFFSTFHLAPRKNKGTFMAQKGTLVDRRFKQSRYLISGPRCPLAKGAFPHYRPIGLSE